MNKRELSWEELVVICILILAVIFLFKILFWISLLAIVVGIIWIIINMNNNEEISLIAVILVIIGIVLSIISYQIGYKFEESEMGKPIVEGARIVLDTNEQINDIQEQALNDITKSLEYTNNP